MNVSFIIVNYNTKIITENCIESIISNPALKNISFEIIVVDNQSSDGSVPYLRTKFGQAIHVLDTNQNLGFGKGNNEGAKMAQGDYLILTNSDTLVQDLNVPTLLEIAENHEDLGILTCKVLNDNGSIQTLGNRFPSVLESLKGLFLFWNYRFIKNIRYRHYVNKGLTPIDWMSGCFMFLKRETFEVVHGFDEQIFMYSEDVDLCARIHQLGLTNYVFDETAIYHLHGKSSNKKRPSLKGLFKNKRNYYYVIKKNHLSHFLFIIKVLESTQLLILWTYKRITSLFR